MALNSVRASQVFIDEAIARSQKQVHIKVHKLVPNTRFLPEQERLS